MTYTERFVRWNHWYDNSPQDQRFRFVLWPLLALGAINLWLTLSVRFPFALLVVLGILFIAVVRIPYVLGWLTPADHAIVGDPGSPRFQIEGAGWVVDLNRRYDAMPESRRFWVYPAVLLAAGAINMLLTIGNHFPFGLLFLLVLLALVAIRAPYTAGWFKPTPAIDGVGGSGGAYATEVEHTAMPAIASEPPPEPGHEPAPLHDLSPLTVHEISPPPPVDEQPPAPVARPIEDGRANELE
jgi:hypothetical protein